MASKSFLVVVHAGDHSRHETWLRSSAARDFDLFVSYAGTTPGRYAGGCDRYEQRQGAKYPALGSWLTELGDTLDGYLAIWLPDDDTVTDTASINRMFKLFSEHQLALAHPAYRQYAAGSLSAQHIDYVLRYASFVSPSAPIFSRSALQACLPVFAKSTTGCALGYIWPKLLPQAADKIAYLDAAPIKRAPHESSATGSFYDESDPCPAEQNLLAEYGVTVPPAEDRRFHGGIELWSPLHKITAPDQAPQPKSPSKPKKQKSRRVLHKSRKAGKRKPGKSSKTSTASAQSRKPARTAKQRASSTPKRKPLSPKKKIG